MVSLPIVLAGAVIALAGGSGSGPSAQAAGAGFVRAANSGSTATAVSSTRTHAAAAFGPNVINGIYQGESPAVSGLPILPVIPGPLHTRDNESLHAGGSSNAHDPVVQHRKGSGPISAPIQSFDGICLPFGPPCAQPSSCSCLPPDTDGEAGANQYVQMVNTDFAVYSKSGAVLRTATPINQLWANTNGECKTHNDGDPVVVYDQLARRWVLSQFIATPTGEPGDDQYGECIAVSTSSDATGSYYLYEFDFGTDVFFDYPKLGVWPDGYYMMANEFPTNSVTSAGTGVFAFERSKMLAGQPARVVFFDESQHNPTGGQYIGMLPGDLEGTAQPATGSPNWFAEVDDPTGIPPNPPDAGFDLRMWKFHVDWTNPANSTFGNNGAPNNTLAVAPFVRPQCVYGYGDCVPQKGGPQELDVLGDRLMFRMPYRKLGSTGSILLNHTVQTPDGRVGVRWYEVRIGQNGSGTPAIYQQGTYAPDDAATNPLWRWMGSIAEDKNGDIAIGYSASGPNDFPSVRYTGRAASDALGQMTQAEQVGFTGTGPQTEVEGRWGDYSQLSVDPADDCTFWYTQEYLAEDAIVIGTWRTRVVSFKFPGCR